MVAVQLSDARFRTRGKRQSSSKISNMLGSCGCTALKIHESRLESCTRLQKTLWLAALQSESRMALERHVDYQSGHEVHEEQHRLHHLLERHGSTVAGHRCLVQLNGTAPKRLNDVPMHLQASVMVNLGGLGDL